MVEFGQSGCIRAKVVVSCKVVLIGQRWLSSSKSCFIRAIRMYLGKNGYIRSRWFYSGKSGSIQAKVVVFGQ